MTTQPIGVQPSIRLGEDFELDLRPRRLRRGAHVLKLERIPLEILVLLLEHKNEIVTREQIVSRVWGEGAFLDTDNSIRGAIRKLRQVLKDDAEAPQFIQTVTGQGYRFIAPVTTGKEHGAEAVEQPAAVGTSAREFLSELDHWFEARRLRVVEEGRSEAADSARTESTPVEANRTSRGWIFAAAMSLFMAACLLSAFAIWRWQQKSILAPGPQHRVVLAVLPFENLSGDPDQEFFSDGLTEEMISQVGKLDRDRLAVIARSSVAKFKGSKLPAKEIGKELNADYLLQGSVRRSSDRVRITVQFVQAGNQTLLWTESYERQLKDVLAVQDSVVRSVAGQIHLALTEEQKARFVNPRQTQPDGYVAYLKGRYYWNKRTAESMQKAAGFFQQAIDSDPSYAGAYSGLADCNSGLSWHGFKSPAEALPKAYTAARKAIEINPESAEAHASLGLVHSHRWEWADAESEFRRALALDPQYANAHHWYGDYLSIRGRHEEALSEARHALELDPLNLMISTWVGLRHYLAHNYPSAIEQNRSSVDLDAHFAAAHLVLGQAYVQAGLHSEGANELKQAASLSGGSPIYTAQVAVALAIAGRKRDAIQIVHELEAISTKQYVSPYGIAQIYAALDNTEDAYKWLQAAYDDHSVWMGYLGVDPVFDRYRSDSRFQEFLRRIGLL